MVAYGALAGLVNAAPVLAAPLDVLALGDSLTAGYGVMAPDSFPAQLERALKAKGHDVRMINAGVSGDTSAGGLARLDWILASHPRAAIVELGANDGLRGLDPARMAANLDAIVAKLQGAGIEVLLTGMEAPPNLGTDYAKAYRAAFAQVAQTRKVAFYPFFLEGVAGRPELNQADGMHPNPKGVEVLVSRLLPEVERLLARVRP